MFGWKRLALVAGVAWLVACGAPALAETVHVAVQPGLPMLPIWVAEKQGFFANNAHRLGADNLDVQITVFTGSSSINDALISGASDLGVGSIPGLLVVWDKIASGSSEIRGLAGVATVRFELYVNRDDIHSLADLKEGEKISVPSTISPQAILLRSAADKALGSSKQAEMMMVSMPHATAVTALMAKSGLTGSFSTPPFSQILAGNPKLHMLLTSRDMLDGKDASAILLLGNRRYVDAHPKIAQAMVDGIREAIAFIKQNPAAAADIYLASDPVKLSRDEIQHLITDGTTVYQAEPAGVMAYAHMMKQQGLIKAEPAKWSDLFFTYVKQGN